MNENSALQQMAARGDAISIVIMCTLPTEAAMEISAFASKALRLADFQEVIAGQEDQEDEV